MLSTVIRTRYAGPTDTRGSRIIVSWDGKRRTVPFDYSATNAHEAAVAVALGLDPADTVTWPRGVERNGTRIFLAPVLF
jgi:hypothetical protein